MAATIAQPMLLSAADRCDRCGARAYLRVILAGGGELLFCAHHGRAHEAALRAREAEILDETHTLAAPPIARDDER